MGGCKMIIQSIATQTLEPFFATVLDQRRREQLTVNKTAVRLAKGFAMYDDQDLVGGLLMKQRLGHDEVLPHTICIKGWERRM